MKQALIAALREAVEEGGLQAVSEIAQELSALCRDRGWRENDKDDRRSAHHWWSVGSGLEMMADGI